MMTDQFEDWIKESAPSVHVNELKKEVHLAVLKERLRAREIRHQRRHHRQRRASMVAVVLMFLLIGGNVSELGSDGFDITITESEALKEKVASIGFRGSEFTLQDDDTEADVEDLAQQIQADLGHPVGISMYEIDGDQFWTVIQEYEVNGQMQTRTQFPSTHESSINESISDFLTGEALVMMREIKSGELLPFVTREESVDGVSFLAKVYRYHSAKHGEVIFLRGKRIW